MGRPFEVLIVDDEPLVGKRLKPALEKEGFRVEIFTDPQEAEARITEKEFDIVVTDIRMEGLDGLDLLDRIRRKSPLTKVIMITGYATLELAKESLKHGAYDFIAKPFRVGTMRDTIQKAAQALRERRGV